MEDCGEGNKEMASQRHPICPRLILSLFAVPTRALIDTGSQITGISESFYKYLSMHGRFDELPVSNVTLYTAIGRKATVIKKQISCDISVGDFNFHSSFLVIPNLSNSIILGNDWLTTNRVVINYNKFEFLIQGRRVPDQWVSFSRMTSNEVVSKHDNVAYIQDMFRDDCWDQKRKSSSLGMVYRNVSVECLSFNDVLDSQGSLSILFNEDSGGLSTSSVLAEVGNDSNDFDYENRCSALLEHPKSNIAWGNIIRESDLVENDLSCMSMRDHLDFVDCFSVGNIDKSEMFFEDIYSSARVLTNLNDVEKNLFVSMMSRYRKLFTPKNTAANVPPYKLNVKPHTVTVRKTYPVPIAYRPKVDHAIQEMLSGGIIEASDSPYCNPIRVVIKGDDSVRICLDARYINSILESDHESPPMIHLMQKFHGVKWMSMTDLATGYWQIPLHSESRKYTAFYYNYKMYQFCRLPFGLKTAGSIFIRVLRSIFGDDFNDILTMYVDDILVTTSGDFHNHLTGLCRIFDVLQQNGFTLSLKKSKFCQQEINFLGHKLSLEGVEPLQDKLDIILHFSRPSNRRELQQFLGLCTFYRQFTLRHSDLIAPFREILADKNPWLWTRDHDRAFQVMKAAFVNCIKLNHYLPEKMYKLQTDASDFSISGILYQNDDDGSVRVVSLVSRCLTEAEMHYSTTEKELLAIIYSVMKLRLYLLGTHFLIITDHKGLVFLNSTPYLNSRLIRWSLLLQRYDFDVEYCKGKDNVIADFFSRNPRGRFEVNSHNELSIDVINVESRSNDSYDCSVIGIQSELCQSLKSLANLQRQDRFINDIIEKIKNDNEIDFFVLKEDILFRKDDHFNA